MIHNRQVLKSRRKELRNNSTPAEKLLWSILQHSNLGGYKFRRQHSVGAYILDFYCPSEKLAVELDGNSHFTDEAIDYDLERTAYLNALNIKVLRFLNTDVYDNLNVVCERILEEINGEDLASLAGRTEIDSIRTLHEVLKSEYGPADEHGES
jgi:very-short-patch-repair endonuclease